jgi:hypothetical protein
MNYCDARKMKKSFTTLIILILFFVPACHGGFLDDLLKGLAPSSEQGMDESTVIAGLKEALSVSTENAVKNVSRLDGYLANEAIRIAMPEKIQRVADVLKKVGYEKQVDEFTTSMNRAAEKAAPKASAHFIGAIKEMTFDDARRILSGADSEATDYFRSKTSDRLYNEFKPVVSSSMDTVGVTRSYKEMMGTYTSLPFTKDTPFDLDHYVTGKALDGLFYMMAQEEKKIRTDPAARVTDLLKKVFSK